MKIRLVYKENPRLIKIVPPKEQRRQRYPALSSAGWRLFLHPSGRIKAATVSRNGKINVPGLRQQA